MRASLGRITFPRVIAVFLALNGALNLLTGLAPVFQAGKYLKIEKVPGYLRLSQGQRISGIMSVFLGVVLIALARGLYSRRRHSWAWTLFLLILLLANNLYRGTTPQTAFLSVALIVALIVLRRRFDVPSDRTTVYAQIFALAAVLLALAYGIVGAYLMRRDFSGIQTWTDAVYFTMVTYSTLGYGDMLPKSENAKIFTVSMIIVGVGSFITALSVLVGPMIEGRMKGVLRIMSRLQAITDHVIVCGYTNVSESIMDELRRQNTPFAVIEPRQELAQHLRQRGLDVIVGDATKGEVLEKANLRKSRAIVAAFDSDSDNTLVALTANEIRKSEPKCRFRLIVRVEDEGNIEKVRHIGADEVVSPSTMGGRLMAEEALSIQE